MFKKGFKFLVLTLTLAFCLGQIISVSAIDWETALTENDWTAIEESVVPFDEIEILEYNQSPKLDSLVEEGDLPAVEDRLPQEPLIVKPTDRVGEYGGDLTLGGPRPHFAAMHHALMETVLDLNRFNPVDMDNLHANIVKDWEMTEDDTVLTLYLREGMKWSDGEPFTAEDFRFHYEDVIFNEDLTTVVPVTLRPLEEVEVVDDYTFRYHFDRSYSQFDTGNLNAFSSFQTDAYAPAHFMKEFHIDYNEDATELAVEEGYDEWTELFDYYYTTGAVTPKEVPVLGPWVKADDVGDAIIFERNPFYWKVDPAGNQLPYCDRVLVRPWRDQETFVTMIISGELDFAGWSVPLGEYPSLKANEDTGNYDAWIGRDTLGNESAFFLNQNVEDDGLAEVFNIKEFRHALSLAVDREEINELVFLEQGEPRQATFHHSVPGVDEKWTEAFIEYDPGRAEDILDSIGIVDENGDGWRQRLDGETLSFNIIVTEDYPFNVNTAELLVSYWNDIDIQAEMQVVSRSLFNERSAAGEYDATLWMIDNVGPNKVPITRGAWFTWQGWALTGVDWADWMHTEGAEGIEPPQVVKDVFDLGSDLPFVDSVEQEKLVSEISDINAEELWIIGTVHDVGSVNAADRELGNVRRQMGSWTGDDVSMAGVGGVNWLFQFYWENEDRR